MRRTQPPAGADFAYAVGVRKLDVQLHRIDALDSKAGYMLAADGLLAGILFGASAVVRTAPSPVTVLLVAFMFASLLLALIAFATRRFEDAPNPERVVELVERGETWLRWRFVKQLLLAIDVNNKKLRWKAGCLAASLAALVAAVTLLGGYLIYKELLK